MFFCLGLIDRITSDGKLQTSRLAPNANECSVVTDWLKDIEQSAPAPDAIDIGPLRVYGKCTLQPMLSKPRSIQLMSGSVRFRLEHRNVPIPTGPAFYSLTLPPGYVFESLTIQENGCVIRNKTSIVDKKNNLASIAFEFWHPSRHGTLVLEGTACARTVDGHSHVAGFEHSEHAEAATRFVDVVNYGDSQGDSAKIRASIAEPLGAVPRPARRPAKEIDLLLVPGYGEPFDRLRQEVQEAGWTIRTTVRDDVDRALDWIERRAADPGARVVAFVDMFEGRPDSDVSPRNQAGEYFLFIQRIRESRRFRTKPVVVLFEHSQAEASVPHGLSLGDRQVLNKFIRLHHDRSDPRFRRDLSTVAERLDNEWEYHPVSSKRAIRVLFLASNPRGSNPLELEAELERVRVEVGRAGIGRSFEMLSRWCVDPDVLRRELLDTNPDVLHFSGHGTRGAQLVLEDGARAPLLVRGEALRSLLSAASTGVRLVVLSACHSKDVALTIAPLVDVAVGMGDAINDEAAVVFACAFYGALGSGRSYSQALDVGRAAIAMWNLPGHELPVLFPRSGLDPAVETL